jgi:hypothetical protein
MRIKMVHSGIQGFVSEIAKERKGWLWERKLKRKIDKSFTFFKKTFS